MFKRQTSVHNKLAAAVVSALFLSVSAHAGLLGVGGGATGVTGATIGNVTGRLGAGTAAATPFGAGSATAQITNQTRVQGAGALSAPPTAATVQQMGQTQGQITSQVGSTVAGQATAAQAAAVSNGEDITQQAERLTRRGRATGQLVLEQATDAQGQVSGQALQVKQAGEAGANAAGHRPHVAADGSVSGSGAVQAMGRNASVSGNASARGTVSTSH